MAVFDLKQLSAEFAKAVNAVDLNAVCDMYADDAVFVPEPGAAGITGSAAIREVLAGFLASRPSMEFEHTYTFQAGDTALARGRWKLTSTGPDGGASVLAGNSIEVLRRQPDGSWRYVVDHPWGADAV